jgi:molybdopterin synthase sulfur carrier subunit
MKIKVKFFATFIEAFGAEEKEVEFEGRRSVLDLLNSLCDSVECRQVLFEECAKLKPYVKVLKNGRLIEHLDGIDTELVEGDLIALFPPEVGG